MMVEVNGPVLQHYEVARCMYAAGLWPTMLSPKIYGIIKQALQSETAWNKLWSGDTEGPIDDGEAQAIALTIRRCVYQSVDVRTGSVHLDGQNGPMDGYTSTEAYEVAHMQVDTAAMPIANSTNGDMVEGDDTVVADEADGELLDGVIYPNRALERLKFALRDLDELNKASEQM